MNTFEFHRLRWYFEARGPLYFAPGTSGNSVRGAFGLLLRETARDAMYQRLFEPRRPADSPLPSGLEDWPRPFVLRTAAIDGRRIAAGESFCMDMHVFDCRLEVLTAIKAALERVAETGLGPARSRAELRRVEHLGTDAAPREAALRAPLSVPLDPEPLDAGLRRVCLRFVTPTELKGGGTAPAAFAVAPEFGILFARLRDRVATLRALYGAGPLAIDFRGLGERARSIELVRSDVAWVSARRRSSRTGQSHPLGGFTGEAEYAGELGEFLPWLRAARWTGVGRQTVWGKGDVRVGAL